LKNNTLFPDFLLEVHKFYLLQSCFQLTSRGIKTTPVTKGSFWENLITFWDWLTTSLFQIDFRLKNPYFSCLAKAFLNCFSFRFFEFFIRPFAYTNLNIRLIKPPCSTVQQLTNNSIKDLTNREDIETKLGPIWLNQTNSENFIKVVKKNFFKF